MEAEGEEENLKAFLEWCKKGPRRGGANVEKTEFEFSDELKNFEEFKVK